MELASFSWKTRSVGGRQSFIRRGHKSLVLVEPCIAFRRLKNEPEFLRLLTTPGKIPLNISMGVEIGWSSYDFNKELKFL